MTRRGPQYLFLGITVLVFTVAWAAMRAYLPAPPQFDDYANLQALAEVASIEDAVDFVMSGVAGPTGRPLSLATFLLHGPGWPASVPEMRHVNLLLHLLNGLLVLWLGLLLARHAAGLPDRQASWAALTGAALWLFSPLLLSSSFMVVQRMTLLSGLFCLAGMICYLKGRISVSQGQGGVVRMVFGVVGFGSLAVLSKENGVLLPFYLLLIEGMLREPLHLRHHRMLRVLLIGAPVFGVIAYLVAGLPEFAEAARARGWTLEQRLLTEARVLWRYLWLALVPRQAFLGPYQDDYPFSEDLFSPRTTLLAISAWGMVLAGMVAAWRHPRWRWAVFGMGWYLSGHLLESTVVALEPYFEHRNYLPLAGPYLALGVMPFLLESRRVVLAGLWALVLLFALVSWQTATTWGRPVVAAELWVRQHPGSERAILYLAGTQILYLNDPVSARQLIERHWRKHPSAGSSAVQAVLLSCVTKRPERSIRRLLDEVIRQAPRFGYDLGVSSAAERLLRHVRQGGCGTALGSAEFDRLVDALLENRLLMRHPGFRSNMYLLKAQAGFERRSLQEVMSWFERAYAETRRAALLVDMGLILESAGLHELALEKIDGALSRLPLHPVRRLRDWLVLTRYRKELKARMHARNGTTTRASDRSAASVREIQPE